MYTIIILLPDGYKTKLNTPMVLYNVVFQKYMKYIRPVSKKFFSGTALMTFDGLNTYFGQYKCTLCSFICCRMDVDQSARNNAQEYFGVKDPDYYEFEGK